MRIEKRPVEASVRDIFEKYKTVLKDLKPGESRTFTAGSSQAEEDFLTRERELKRLEKFRKFR